MEYYHEKVETEAGVPARIYYSGSGRDKLHYPLHWHQNLELNLVLEGCIRGKTGGVETEAGAGEIFFVNSGELHETDGSCGGSLRSVTLLLEEELLREYCPNLDEYYFKVERGSSQERRLGQLMEQCAQVQKEHGEFYQLDLAILLRQICRILLGECRCRREKDRSLRAEWKSTRRIKQALSYMEEHYDRLLSIQEMGKEMGMSPTYFSRFFRKSTGQTFHSYLTSIRLCRAREVLLEGEESVTGTALSCGFPNVKSFIEVFKREYGFTPAQYRRRMQLENQKEDKKRQK